jgi:hypothetical protein
MLTIIWHQNFHGGAEENYKICTESRGWPVNTPASDSGGPELKPRPGGWMNPIVIFFNLSRQMPGYLKQA